MTLLKNAYIITCDGNDIENGYILIEETHIKSVGSMENAPDFQGEEIDLKGKYVMPGMIDAHSHIGLFGDSGAPSEKDGNESNMLITPHLRALDGVNPLDGYFREAVCGGVTTVCVCPGSANPIGGSCVIMKTAGESVDECAVVAEGAMKFAFGENPKNCHNGEIRTRMTTAAVIREALFKAKEYDGSSFDMKSASLKRVIGGGMPVKAHAHRADDILTAVRISKEFGLKLSLEHCTEGHLIWRQLKKENVPCCIGPVIGDRSKPELRNKTCETMRIFEREGIDFSIITDHPEIEQGSLLLCAQVAVKNGVSSEVALRAVTKNPAKALGVYDRIGSITAGKEADLAVFDKYPLEFDSKVCAVYLNGKKMV